MITAEQLSDEIKSLRSKRPRITSTEAAAIAGVSNRTWQRIEAGEYYPTLEALMRFAENRGVPISAMLGDLPPQMKESATRGAEA